MSEFITWINGKEYNLHKIEPEVTLLQFIRSIGLAGTKLGCGEGGCGACTVVVGNYDGHNPPTYYSVNACLAPLPSVHEKHVLTVEGIGSTISPHIVQSVMAGDASQCGFCTPGFVMSLYSSWRNKSLNLNNIEEELDGNLCRCTGYRPIIDAARKLCGMGEECCRNKKSADPSPNQIEKEFDPTQEIIFPPKLKLHLQNHNKKYVRFQGRVTWHRPVTMEELLSLKSKHPDGKIVFGNTEVGVEVKFKNQNYPTLIYAGDIQELNFIKETDEGIIFGSGVNLNEIKKFATSKPKEHKYLGLETIKLMLKWFAGNQIRNVSSWAGNLATASPISDLNPVWASAGAKIILKSKDSNGDRIVPVSRFFLGYRKVDMLPNEVIFAIILPFTENNEFIAAYKQSKRRDDDITIVNAAFRVRINDKDKTIQETHYSFGGMGPTTIISKTSINHYFGKRFELQEFITTGLNSLKEEFNLPPDVIGGMPDYRMALVLSLFFKFSLEFANHLGIEIDDKWKSSIKARVKDPVQSSQYFEENNSSLLTGKPIPHISALKHSTGNAQYIDDFPRQHGELYAGLVLSNVAHAKLIDINISKALDHPGVHGVVTYKDVPGNNKIGPVFDDEFIFCEELITACGQLIAIVLADDQIIAQRAAKLVEIKFERLPLILTIDDAIKLDSFHPHGRQLCNGDIDSIMKDKGLTILEGSAYIGGQEHFYLETQAALVIPKGEDQEIEIIASTQNPTEGQHFVSRALKIPCHKVSCRVRRIGGGFGGKETRSSFLIAALATAANKVKRPVRCMLDRNEDMIYSGQRHPFKVSYKLAINPKTLKFAGADISLFSNGGHSVDLSLGVLDRAMTHSDNSYYFPVMRVIGKICKTNLPSNTAFRGFGGPQGNFFCETMIAHAAQVLKVEAEAIRRNNLYVDGEMTHFKMKLEDPPLSHMWDTLEKNCNFKERKLEIEKFNERNEWVKRGITMIPTKFGISFGVKHLNQAGALVHIYNDGTILLTHGGIEMGQGLHTKMCQIAADVFKVPLESVHFSETSTTTVPNSSATAASASSDLYGMAVLNACKQIEERLKPYMSDEKPFKKSIDEAFRDRIDLSAHGFYLTPEIGFDWETQTGRLYNYFTFGVCCSEVEVDMLTGDHAVLRTDIIMDLGRSLNPTIDIGQIEGAFIQGLGLFTIEQPLWLKDGMLLNRGPGNYKIPTAGDIPRVFNVSLLKGSENKRAVHSSKAVGEPPLFLAASVFFAIHKALLAQNGDGESPLILDSPATSERIRLSVKDPILGGPIDPRKNKDAWCFEV